MLRFVGRAAVLPLFAMARLSCPVTGPLEPDGGEDAGGGSDGAVDDATTGHDGGADAGHTADAGEDAGGGDGARPLDASGDGAFVPATHTPFPLVPFVSDAGVLGAPRVVTILIGNDPDATDLLAFGTQVPQSAWFQAWAPQYGVGTARASQSLSTGSMPPMPDGGYAPLDLSNTVAQAITGDNSLIAPDGHTIFVLYLPKQTYFQYGGQPGSCAYFAYHTGYGSLGDGVAYVQRCGTPPLDGSDINNATRLAAHEIAEAATDTRLLGWVLATSPTEPWAGNVWGTADGAFASEVGDLCGLQTRVTEGSYSYQRIYSNAAVAAGGDPCVPPLATTYYNTSTPKGWYPGTPGTTVAIPVTGWSSAPIAGGWLLSGSTRVETTPRVGWSYYLSSAGPTYAGVPYHAIDNGTTTTMNVTVPSTAPSGSFISIMILSERLDSTGAYMTGEDFGHRWLVGVYVP